MDKKIDKPEVRISYVYGVDYTTRKYKYISANPKSLAACFSNYPYKMNENVLKDVVYCTVYLDASIERYLGEITALFDNYPLTFYPQYYLKKVTIKPKDEWSSTKTYYTDSSKEDADIALYTIRMDVSQLHSYLAKYYISLCVLMYIRHCSPGESYYKEYQNVKNDATSFLDKSIAVNNSGIGHRLYNIQSYDDYYSQKKNYHYLTPGMVRILNDIELVDKIFKATKDTNVTIEFKKNSSYEVCNEDPRTYTTEFMNYLISHKKGGIEDG